MTSKLRGEKHDTFPGSTVPEDETGPDPEPAPARPDGYRYERPRLDDSMSVRLLDGLNAERFPRSTTIPQTDGQLAAHYQVGPKALPAAVPTPPPEPSVLVRTSVSVPLVVPTSPVPRPSEDDSTVAMVLPIRRPKWLVVGSAMAATTALGALGLVVMHKQMSPPHSAAASVEPAVEAPAPPVMASAPFIEIAPLTTASALALPEPSAEPTAKPVATAPWRAPTQRAAPPKSASPTMRHVAASKEPDVPPSSKIDKSDRE
jgi:hypothetical protein